MNDKDSSPASANISTTPLRGRFLLVCACLLLSAGPALAASGVVDLPDENVTATYETPENPEDLSPGAVSIIRPTEEDRGVSLPDLIERTPGLHVIRARGRGGYTVASVRGSTSAQVAVYLDGILMNLGSEAAVDLSTIAAEDILRIETYRGYIPARFGASGMGGVINIVTKGYDQTKTEAQLGVGSYGGRNLSFGTSGTMGSGRYYFGGGYESSDGDFSYDNDNGTPYNSDDDYRARRRDNDHENSHLLFKWGNSAWQGHASWTRTDRSLPLAAAGADKETTPQGARTENDRFDISLARRWVSRVPGDVEWGLRAEYLHQDLKFADPFDTTGGYGEENNRYKTERLRFSGDASWTSGIHFFELFASYTDETLKPSGDITDVIGGHSRMSNRTMEASLQDSIPLTKDATLILVPSLRYSGDDEDGKVTWQLAATKSLQGGFNLFATGGTYARSPNLYERYGDGAMIRPNSDLRWETGSQWDVGVGWDGMMGDAPSSARLSWFSRDSKDLIEFVMSSSRYGVYQNIGKAKIQGLELEFAANWPQGLKLSGGATWMDSEDRTDGSYRYGSPLPNRPEWDAYLRLAKEWNKQTSAFAELHYTGENYYDTTGSVKMEDLLLFNIGLAHRLKGGGLLSLRVDDVFDSGPDLGLVSTSGASRMAWYPLQGRTIFAGLSWSF